MKSQRILQALPETEDSTFFARFTTSKACIQIEQHPLREIKTAIGLLQNPVSWDGKELQQSKCCR